MLCPVVRENGPAQQGALGLGSYLTFFERAALRVDSNLTISPYTAPNGQADRCDLTLDDDSLDSQTYNIRTYEKGPSAWKVPVTYAVVSCAAFRVVVPCIKEPRVTTPNPPHPSTGFPWFPVSSLLFPMPLKKRPMLQMRQPQDFPYKYQRKRRRSPLIDRPLPSCRPAPAPAMLNMKIPN